VTVIAPSHAAALQLRRRLAEHGPFAAVRFEPLARIAELLGAGELAAQGRTPLARPIGDYVAEQVARESQGLLSAVSDLPGYARVVRGLFRRLRRGGIRSSADVQAIESGHLPEVLRLYDRFRKITTAFYDDEDLLDAAADAVRADRPGLLSELGKVYAFPSTRRSAGADALLNALTERAGLVMPEASAPAATSRFVLAPDPSTEVREAVREVIRALQEGVAIDEVAVLHGADPAYGAMLEQAFVAADIPASTLPGRPLIETPTARGVLGLLELPAREYARTATMDALSIAPLRRSVPGTDGERVRVQESAWDRLSREAGVTRGLARWSVSIHAYTTDQRVRLDSDAARESEGMRTMIEREVERADGLRAVIEGLAARLEPLAPPQSAEQFVATLRAFVVEYFDPAAAALDDVLGQIDQLGTVAAVGGTFTLPQFVRALRANLEAQTTRTGRLGDGALVAAYGAADGMQFRHVVLCGAREGAFPAGAGPESLVEDNVWTRLRQQFPFIEDAPLRIERERDAAQRAIAASSETIVWCAPLYEGSGTREFYPSPLMVAAARTHDASVTSGTTLREHPPTAWLRRGASPLSLRLAGSPIDAAELRLREAVALRQRGEHADDQHPRWRMVQMSHARTSNEFTAWDGNLAEVAAETRLHPDGKVSPTSMETYGGCGFKYFARSALRLNVVDSPEERELMDPAAKGSLVHRVIEAFFREQQAASRPGVAEAWTDADREHVFGILDQELEEAAERGLLGLDIFAGHERQVLRADLAEFLAQDSEFRAETRAVPHGFEVPIPETDIAGVTLRGFADRIDMTPDGKQAWVIDYKTGSTFGFGDMKKDPLQSGKKLQLPAYLLAVPDAEEAEAFYWFISQKGGFEHIGYERNPERDKRFRATLQAIVEGIGAGAFPAVPGEWKDFNNNFENCGYCEFDRICARRRDDAFADKAGGDNAIAWLRVSEAAGVEQ
jgi:RecB family exonuclease